MLNRVTITGADNNTDISAMVALSQEFPFVEWGILVSRSQEGTDRFPSSGWMESFAEAALNNLYVSMHVCGRWVRELLVGKLHWENLPWVRMAADRVQINTHAQEHVSTLKAFDWMAEYRARQFIIQLDGVNDHLLDVAVTRNLNIAGLFDQSHGAGRLPESWPQPTHLGIYHGYAGGLGPDNVRQQLKCISRVAGATPYWIDMEGQVRTEDVLDLDKVRRVLEICAPWVARDFNEY